MIPDQMNDNHLSSNYRPILNNLQPMYKRACSFICKFKLITKQFGFKANYSTEHALISPIETTKCDLDSGLYVCGFMFVTKPYILLIYKKNRTRLMMNTSDRNIILWN